MIKPMSEQELRTKDDAFLQSVSYQPTVLPSLSDAPSSRSGASAKLVKAAKLLLHVGPFKLFKAVHRKIVLGSVHRCCHISRRRRAEEEAVTFKTPVTFSLLVPLYNTPIGFLNDMIASVQAQTYPHWELCLADGSDDAHAEVGRRCLELASADKRILYRKLERNEGISGNTNACIAMSTGQYISLFDHDDLLHPSALFETMKAIEERNADLVYTDEATFVRHGLLTALTYHYKPDFAVDCLRANNYICHFTSFSRELLNKAGVFRHEYDGSQDHDMMLRLTEQAETIVHVPKLLYFWRSHKASVASDINSKPYAVDAGQRAVHDSIVRMTGRECTVRSSRAFPAIYNTAYELADRPLISILLPTDGNAAHLTRCIASILHHTAYDRYEILVARSIDDDAAVYEQSARSPRVRVLSFETGRRNDLLNCAAEEANGEVLVLMSDRLEAVTEDWLEQLLMFAQREDVGAVGAKLLHPDGTVHHAGYVLGLGKEHIAGLEHHDAPYSEIGHRGRLCFARNVSAVSSACLMIRRDVFDAVGGMTAMPAHYGDVDLCLRLRDKGLLNVFTPHAELVTHDSCVPVVDAKADERFRNRHQDALDAGDPYFNPHFSLDHTDIRLK